MPLGRHVVHYQALGSRAHPRHFIGSTPTGECVTAEAALGPWRPRGPPFLESFPPKNNSQRVRGSRGGRVDGAMGLRVPSFLHLGRVPASCRDLVLCHVTSVTLASDSPLPSLSVLNNASHPGLLVPAQIPGTTPDMNPTVSFGLILFHIPVAFVRDKGGCTTNQPSSVR